MTPPEPRSAPPANVAVVFNPRSAGGKTGRRLQQYRTELEGALPQFTLLETQRPGHATELTRRALHDGYDRIVSAGGDGTNHEIANGFFEGDSPINPEAVMALFPLGTGSDLARTLGIPAGREAIPFLLNQGLPADVGRITMRNEEGEPSTRYFINAVHAGVGGDVAYRVNTGTKILGGFLTYFLGVVTARIAYTCPPMEIDVDGEIFSKVCLEVIIAKGQYDGGGMHMAPRARLDSGTFEVFILGEVGVLGSALNLPHIYRGTLDTHPKVTYRQARCIEIRSPEPLRVSPDGELPGRLPARVEVVPRALRLAVGPNAPGSTGGQGASGTPDGVEKTSS